jgi:hypothetical protein
MHGIRELLLAFSIVCFAIGGFTWRGDPAWPWGGRLISAGLCFFALSFWPGLNG